MEVLRRSFDPFECGSKCSHWVFNYTCSLGTVLGIFIIGTITKEPLRKSSCMSYLEQMLFNKCNLSHANPLSLESFRGIHFIPSWWREGSSFVGRMGAWKRTMEIKGRMDNQSHKINAMNYYIPIFYYFYISSIYIGNILDRPQLKLESEVTSHEY